MLRQFGLLAVVLTVMLACSPSTSQQPTPISSAPSISSSPQATTPAQPTGAAAAPSFSNLISGSKQASYKAVYKMSGTSQGQSMSGEQTWYSKPPKTRMDFTATTQGGGGSASMYLLEDGAYMCSSMGGQHACFKSPEEQAMQQNQGAQVQDQVQEQPDKFDTTYIGPRQIAGQQGQCFAIKPKAGTQADFTESTVCYSAQGIPLLIQSKGQNFDMTMEATSVSTSVADSDFKLPSEPMTMPQFPGGQGGMPNIPGGR